MLLLYRSNRAERLCDALAEVVRVPLADPFAAERIVIQQKGMERWLAMELSRRLGVWANPRFPFPRHLIDGLLRAVLGPRDEAGSAFDEGALTWAVAQALAGRLDEPAFAPVARYLAGDDPQVRTVDLAERIAGVFDDYVVYRPEMVLRWAGGEGDDWQALLFRDLVARHGAGHQASRALELTERLRVAEQIGLPSRISVFGVATLPPLHLSVFTALAERIDVHMFLLTPTREYFADVRRLPAGTGDGPPLLASLGRLGRDFQSLLEEDPRYHESGVDWFVDPGTGTALATLQSDILNLRRRGKDGDAPALPLAPDDRSISIHACHGPMREVEVLHDQLVDLMHDGSVHPDEIVVLTPDIETYAPYIDAVFGVPVGRPPVPYACVRRKVEATAEVVETFGAVLDALGGRMEASTVLDLLGAEVIRERFGIAATEVETARRWVAESGIRWGEDAAHRAQVGQPAFDENTWRFGLERILLGHAFEGDGLTLFAGRLPYAGAAGGEAALAGKLADLCERLFAYRRALAAPRPVSAWCDALAELLGTMIASSPLTDHQHQGVREAIETVRGHAARAGFEADIDLPTLRRRLATVLDDALPARGFMTGGVTFCQLVPMRAIPFRVVCLVGMNDETFPRRPSALGFDRIAEQPAPGDRSAREDDRHAFLDALLSTRERLIVTYVGQSVQDNSVIPPSVVVHELLDAMRESFVLPGNQKVEERLVVRHRLQPFSPAYFQSDAPGSAPASAAAPAPAPAPALCEGPSLFSYAMHHFAGARALAGDRIDRVFAARPVCAPEPEFELSLDEFERYVTEPIRTFLRRRLGVTLGDESIEVRDREPITLDRLEDWKLGDEALRRLLLGVTPEAVELALLAGGGVPLGTAGDVALGEILPRAQALAARALASREGGRLDPLDVSFVLDGVRVTGLLRDLWPAGHVSVGYSKAGRHGELVHWLRHVLLNHALSEQPRPGYARDSVMFARAADDDDEIVELRLGPLEDAATILRPLVALVRLARTEPVPLFRYASRAYAEAHLVRGKEAAAALASAATVFDKRDDDLDVRLCFPSFDLACAPGARVGFVAATECVYGPFFAARRGG